jgi:ribosomal protein S18 acetylase RimI-like enzyme
MVETSDQLWHLREAGPEDVEALALIGAATFLETFAGILDRDAIIAHCRDAHSEQTYANYLANGSRAWLAELPVGRAPVGYAMTAKPDIPGEREGDIELKRIYALSRMHGTGLGRALMETVADASSEFKRVILGVYARNERAIAFYCKQGFEIVGTRQFNVGGNFYDDQVLALPLSNPLARQ